MNVLNLFSSLDTFVRSTPAHVVFWCWSWLVFPAGTWMNTLILGLRLCFVISVQAAPHRFEFEREAEVKDI